MDHGWIDVSQADEQRQRLAMTRQVLGAQGWVALKQGCFQGSFRELRGYVSPVSRYTLTARTSMYPVTALNLEESSCVDRLHVIWGS